MKSLKDAESAFDAIITSMQRFLRENAVEGVLYSDALLARAKTTLPRRSDLHDSLLKGESWQALAILHEEEKTSDRGRRESVKRLVDDWKLEIGTWLQSRV